MELLREVKTNERLPDKDGAYYIPGGAAIFSHKTKAWTLWETGKQGITVIPSFWFEPIEITKKEVERVVMDNVEGSIGDHGIRVTLNPKAIALAILSKLSGE